MARAGHRSMQTTKLYLHLTGVVFRDEANALEARLLGSGGRTFYQPNLTSANLTARKPAEQGASAA